jgi:uncharacterized protein YjbI with pentapeptide repeats
VPTCDSSGCGAKAVAEKHCLEHASEQQLCEEAASWLLGKPLDAREASVSSAALTKLLRALASSRAASHPSPLQPNLKGPFGPIARFESACFVDRADFSGVRFEGQALFDGAKFLAGADFSGAEFLDHADFDNVCFQGPVDFDQAIFNDHAGFQEATFTSTANFGGVRFRSHADFERARFEKDASFKESTFQLSRRLGPIVAAERLQFDRCVFGERLTIDVDAKVLSAQAAIFADGVRLSVRKAAIFLNEADFGRASTLSSSMSSATSTLDDHGPDNWQGRLITVRGAQVARLSLSDLDLRACRFFGAHGLESLNVEPSCTWPRTPSTRRRIDREMIAEEHQWRCEREAQRRRWKREHWSSDAADPQDWPDPRTKGEPLDPAELAALYRSLRKAREDNKDQAGAGDLYYGEMEMRRRVPLPKGRGKIRAFCDRWIIIAYWLLSGYGLKASRAFGAWIVLTLAGAFAFLHCGISPTPSFRRGVLFAIESTSSLVRPAHLPDYFTVPGAADGIQMVLRLTGPVLIGLFLLALRGRVKR